MNNSPTRADHANARVDGIGRLAILSPVLCLLPFVNKAFHIDDPVYLWVAQHIQSHPLDFYGFSANWSFFQEPMYEINKNPPGVSWFIALAAFVVGWSEAALHGVFLLPVFLLSLGTYRIAQCFSCRPATAVVVSMLAPVTLVSASNVMSDALTLCLCVWSVVFWIRALKNSRLNFACVAMALLGAAILTKYLAVCFVPLLVAYAILERGHVRYWMPSLAILVAIVGAYLFWSYRLYGLNPLAGAASFALDFEDAGTPNPPGARFATGLAFAGGSYVVALFLLPVIWRAKTAVAIAVIPTVALLLLFLFGSNFAQMLMHSAFDPLPGFHPQLVLFCVAGFHVLYLAADDWRRNRTNDAVLLALWVFGIFVFSTFVNWTVNGRTMLPMAPAVGILIARRVEAMGLKPFKPRVTIPLVAATAVALVVLWSDARLAAAGRTAAELFADHHDETSAAWIQGNWGPRWYFEAAGALPFDTREPQVKVGDTVIQSSNNLVFPLPPEITQSLRTDTVRAGGWVTTMDRRTGAGFYSSVWGPLPYAFGPVPDERYHYLRLAAP